MSRISIVFALLFAMVGSIFLIIAYKEWAVKRKIISEGIETVGQVITLYEKPRKANEIRSTSMAPVILFVTEKKQIIKYYSTTFLTPCPYQIGQQVKIKYLPKTPHEAILDWKDAWILSIAFGIFGGVICLITYTFLLKSLYKGLFKK
jgi:Protein of unknown function (DUF3592)